MENEVSLSEIMNQITEKFDVDDAIDVALEPNKKMIPELEDGQKVFGVQILGIATVVKDNTAGVVLYTDAGNIVMLSRTNITIFCVKRDGELPDIVAN